LFSLRLGLGSRSAPSLLRLSELKKVMIMEKKLSLWLLGAIGLLALIYGCQNMAKEMSYGEILYRAKCSSCHNVIEPSRHDKEAWDIYINKYGQKMTAEEKQVVLQYLVDYD
jgi:hypothetical protein